MRYSTAMVNSTTNVAKNETSGQVKFAGDHTSLAPATVTYTREPRTMTTAMSTPMAATRVTMPAGRCSDPRPVGC